ncbi:hypothetical protein CHUAL_007342 [Chamberlinius hualienensis]
MADEEPKDQIKIYGNTKLSDRVALFNKKTKDHREKQLVNPFSNWEGAGHRQTLSKSDVGYGRPVEGSKTEYRGKKAGELITSEIKTLCEMIWEFGEKNEAGTARITFGELFEIYTRISNKLVGILMRARKYGLLNFKGEMLFQRRDDNVVIELLRSIREIRNGDPSGEPEPSSSVG